MSYLIRTRDGSIVATHEGPGVEHLTVPTGETAERFDNRDAFAARVAELTPAPGPDPSEDLAARLEALAAKQSPTVKELITALLGTDANASGAVAGRPT